VVIRRREVIGDCELLLGDCLEILPTLGPVDAVVTDPPYGINWKPRVNHQDQRWIDNVQFDPAPFLAVGRYHLFWGAQYFADRLPPSEGWVSWVKRPVAGGDFSNDLRSYSTTELAWRNWGKARHVVHVWDGGMRAGAAENRTFCHPSQKPVEVMDWCIRHSPADAQTILDPFMGSGTTLVACAKLGRRGIGIEIDEGYFEIACGRVRKAYAQPDLFVAPPAAPVQEPLL
jgi:site-specific DNA-methyltransferase (adenine-specific)/modification methylase